MSWAEDAAVRRRGGRGILGALGLVLTVTLVGSAVMAVPASAAPSELYPSRQRSVCSIPRPGNNGKTLGHDGGMSVAYHGRTYWFFGDAFSDANGDGIAQPIEFKPGPMARSDDTDASDCVDLTYKTIAPGNGPGRTAPAVPPLADENTTWGGGGVVANDKLYWVFAGVHRVGGTGVPFRSGLAVLTDEESMASRRAVELPQDIGMAPVNVDGYVYFFRGWTAPQPNDPNRTDTVFPYDTTSKVFVARVPEASIEDPTAYRYWLGGQVWGTDPDRARPIMQEGGTGTLDITTTPLEPVGDTSGISGAPSIAYNAALDRFVAVYTCGVLGLWTCARTAVVAGNGAAALIGGWNAPRQLFACGQKGICVQSAQHPSYANGSKIYVTHAVDWPPTRDRYRNTMYEVDLSSMAPPVTREHRSAEADYRSTQDAGGWSYWSRSRYTGALTRMAWVPATERWAPTGFGLVWIDRYSAMPGPANDAVRIWTAPADGTVEISGEARRDATCGDGTAVEISLAGTDGKAPRSLWSRRLAAGWSSDAGATFDLQNVAVRAGDQLRFRVGAGPATTKCDHTQFKPTLVYDRT